MWLSRHAFYSLPKCVFCYACFVTVTLSICALLMCALFFYYLVSKLSVPWSLAVAEHCIFCSSAGKCHHMCSNKVCLAKSSLCDGIIDCKDRSDEVNCTRNRESPFQYFLHGYFFPSPDFSHCL